MSTAPAARPGAIRRFLGGVGLLFSGFRTWGTAPKLLLLGALPALIVALLITAAIVLLVVMIDDVGVALTPFAATWDEPWRAGVRALAGIAVLLGSILLAVFTFTAVTLLVGAPFYERIWLRTEQRLGNAPTPPDETFWRMVGRSIGDGIRTFLPTVGLGILLLPLGLIPVAGGALVAIIGAIGGGWFLAVELTGFAFDGRGISLTNRRRALRADRATALGFGMATYLLFLIPLVSAVAMPAAVVGASLLSRRVLGVADAETNRPIEAPSTG